MSKFANAYKRDRCRGVLLEIFWFEDEDDYEEEIYLSVFLRVFSKKRHQSFTVRFFSPETWAQLFLLQVKPSTEYKMLKFLSNIWKLRSYEQALKTVVWTNQERKK